MVWVNRSISVTSKQDALTELFGAAPSASGERVNADTVFSIPAFTQAVRIISTAAGRADCYPYRAQDDGGRVIDENSPAYPLLTFKANKFQTYYAFRQTLVANAIYSGDGFGLIERDELSNPVALYNLDSRETYPILEYTAGRLTDCWYGVNTGEGQIVIPSDDVIHVRNIALHSGIEGLSLVQCLKSVLGLAIAQVKFASVIYKHGSHINKVLKIPGWLTQEQQDQLRTSMQNLHAGVANAHRLSVLMGGAELETFPIDLEASQLNLSRQFSIIDVANAVGLPSSFLNSDMGTRSYGSLEQDSLNLLNYTLDGWLTGLESELTCKLIKPRQQKRCFIEFDRASLFSTDPSYVKMQTDLYHAEGISWQELRQRLRLSTSREGQFVRLSNVVDPNKPEPQPQQIVDAQQEQPEPESPQEQQEQPQELEAAEQVERGLRLTAASLDRLKTRLANAVESDADLRKHEDVIRANLDGLNADLVIEQLDELQPELDAVLPEQRKEVIEKWNIEQTAKALWQS